MSRRFGGRVLLSRGDGYAMYVGSNGSAGCEVCGSRAELSQHLFGEKRWLLEFLLALARKRVHRKLGKEIPCMKKPQDYAGKLAKLPDRIAAVLAKTVAVQGDAFEVDDSVALMMILDTINDLDPSLIERNANKKLARPKRSS